MSSTVINITFNCADPHGLSQFWAAVTDGQVRLETAPDGSEYAVVSPGYLPRMVFCPGTRT